MQKRRSFFPTFLIFFTLSILLFLLSRGGFLNGLTGFFETVTVPLQGVVFGTTHPARGGDAARLGDENRKLSSQIVKQTELVRENQALRDQFKTSNPAPATLLPAAVIGNFDNRLTLDRGKADRVEKGDVVVVRDNMIGKIDKVSQHLSTVNLVIASNILFTAKTLKTESIGILKGQGSGLILDNVNLTDRLDKDDLVVTKGDEDLGNSGFPPGLVVGKIISVNKKTSNLFQSAEVASMVDFGKLETVFVITTK